MLSSLILCNSSEPSQLDCDMQSKVDFIQKLVMAGWTEKIQSTAQSQTCTKERSWSLVVCCWSDPLQLSESWRKRYIREVCSANRWDAPKTAMPTAGIGQQNGPNSSPKENLSTYETTNTSEVVLQSFASSAIFMWPLTKQLPLLQVSWQLCRENISKTNRRQKMLSKSSSNPKALIFML